jgi:hypothetical protein
MVSYPFRERMPFLQPPVPPRGIHIFPRISPVDFVLLEKICIHRPIVENESAVWL